MCAPYSHDPRFIPSEGRQRDVLIAAWIAEDQKNGITGAANALVLWRNEVLERLVNRRPCSILIPRRFVAACDLASQKVWIDTDASVWTHPPQKEGSRQLVAAFA